MFPSPATYLDIATPNPSHPNSMPSRKIAYARDQLSAEQISRYREIYQTLRAYAKGQVSMQAVAAIPHAEILETRRWVNDVSVTMLAAELPALAAYVEESPT